MIARQIQIHNGHLQLDQQGIYINADFITRLEQSLGEIAI